MVCWLVLSGADALAGRVGCLECHRPHYATRGRCVGCHRGDDRSDRPIIAHRNLIRGRYAWFTIPGSQPLLRGEQLLESFACRRCHNTAGKGNHLASDLDRLPPNSDPQQIFASIKSPALFMPDFGCDDRQIADLVNAIQAGTRHAGRRGGETPQVVHFDKAPSHRENVFEKRCGPCHKVLTQARGALGKGSIGPNLSGFFSRQYPVTLKNDQRWTADLLGKWLQNPRKIREQSQMQPVPLTKEESVQLLAIFAAQ